MNLYLLKGEPKSRALELVRNKREDFPVNQIFTDREAAVRAYDAIIFADFVRDYKSVSLKEYRPCTLADGQVIYQFQNSVCVWIANR